jgi:hypothetical protein
MTDFVKVRQSDHRFAVRTEGLKASGFSEISVDVAANFLEDSERFLRYVSDDLLGSGKVIKPGETMAHGYWLVKFQGPHGFINGVGKLNAAAEALSAIGTFLKGRLVGAR